MVGMIRICTRNINMEMVQEGYAEAYLEYLKEPFRMQFLQAQREAKSSKIGIWALRNYERRNDFRKRLKVRGGNG
jgi:endonuclease YncB( thermonuclease family)